MSHDSSQFPTLLLLQRFPEAIELALAEKFRVVHVPAPHDPSQLDPEVISSVRGIATGGVRGASRKLMEQLPALEIVAICGVGTDAVDLQFTESGGIRVTTTPSVLTDDVADFAIGLLIATARQICAGHQLVQNGCWSSPSAVLTTKVSGKHLGIIGLGQIGRAIAKRAQGFGMRVSYCHTSRVPEVPYHYLPDVVELAREVDFLVVAASGGASTRGLVSAAVLDALGPKGILINVARGSIVDESALIVALRDGRLGGAGLDVFADEPRVPDALREHDNVVLSPHRASATVETRHAMGMSMLENLAAHFAGQVPAGLVASHSRSSR